MSRGNLSEVISLQTWSKTRIRKTAVRPPSPSNALGSIKTYHNFSKTFQNSLRYIGSTFPHYYLSVFQKKFWRSTLIIRSINKGVQGVTLLPIISKQISIRGDSLSRDLIYSNRGPYSRPRGDGGWGSKQKLSLSMHNVKMAAFFLAQSTAHLNRIIY